MNKQRKEHQILGSAQQETIWQQILAQIEKF